MKTIACKVVIPSDRQLHLAVPEDIPPGPAEVVLVIAPDLQPKKGLTAGDLLRSPLCGMGTALRMPASCGRKQSGALVSDIDRAQYQGSYTSN
jgi:hypothetical protein